MFDSKLPARVKITGRRNYKAWSKPDVIGKEGYAENYMWHPGTVDVKITLDNGLTVWGWLFEYEIIKPA